VNDDTTRRRRDANRIAATASTAARRDRRVARRTAKEDSHHAGLYTCAFGLVALLVILIALVIDNTRHVKLSWVVGTGHASLVWIILASAVLGWLLGIVMSVVFRLRTGADFQHQHHLPSLVAVPDRT
jgi:uncharacterized integral membrane protein